MYILYETPPDVSHHHNWIEEIGQYLNYRVGYFDDELLYSHRLPKMIPLPNKDVAMAWKFAGNLTGNITVREGTIVYDQLDKNSLREYKDKFKYYLTLEDKLNAAQLMKIALYGTVTKYFSNCSDINFHVAPFYDAPFNPDEMHKSYEEILRKINDCATIEDCNELMYTDFGYSRPPKNEGDGLYSYDETPSGNPTKGY